MTWVDCEEVGRGDMERVQVSQVAQRDRTPAGGNATSCQRKVLTS